VLDLAQTWNDSGTTFTALRINVTNTASGNQSTLAEFQVAGTAQTQIRRDGYVLCNGITSVGQSWIPIAGTNSGPRLTIYNGFCLNRSTDYYGWASGATISANSTGDLRLYRDAANTLGQRNTTNAQTFNIYNTYDNTNANNYERGFLKWNSNVFQIGTEAGSGGGTARNIEFIRSGVAQLTIGNTSHSFNGEVSAGNMAVNAAGQFRWLGSRSRIASPANSRVQLLNNASDGFDRLSFGPESSSFPALKVSTTTLQVRLGDDSAFTAIQAGNLVLTDNTGDETATFDAQSNLTGNRTYTLPDASGTLALTTLVGAPVEYVIACSDETTDLTTGTAKVTFRAPVAFLLTGVAASVNTAPTGSTLIVDINNGANSALSTKLSIDASEKTSATAATAAVIDTSYDDFAADAEITIDIDQIGSTIAGKGLKVILKGTRA